MRLRLKGQTCTYGVTDNVVVQDNASWQQLNQAIIRLHPELASSSYNLSLNKKVHRSMPSHQDWLDSNASVPSWQKRHAGVLTLAFPLQDALHASADACVKSLGICSGDLLWIQVDSAPQPGEKSKGSATAHQASPGQHHRSGNRQQQAAPGQVEAGVSHLHRHGQLQQQAERGQEAGAGMGPSVGLADTPGRLAAAVHQTLLDGSLHHIKASLADL